MTAEVTAEMEGREVRLSMTIGALERVAKVNPVLGEVYGALAGGVWKLEELRAVLDAGLAEAGEDAKSGDVIAALGLRKSADLARRALAEAFGDHPGNASSAAETGKTPASGSSTT